MTYQVHYESKPGMWERYTGVKEVEADGADGAIDKAYRLIRRDFPDRPRSGWIFTVNSQLRKGCTNNWRKAI